MLGRLVLIVCLCILSISAHAKSRQDMIAPRIKILPMAKNISAGQNLEFNVYAQDRSGIKSVELYYRKKGKKRFKKLAMKRHGKSSIFKIIVKRLPAKGIEYYVQSTDKAGNTAAKGNTATPLVYNSIKPKPKKKFNYVLDKEGIYIGGRLSQTSLEYNVFQQGGSGYRLFGGYELNKYISFELGYSGSGEAQGVDDNEALPRYVTMSNSGFDLMGVFNYRLNKKTTLFSRLGMFFWSSDLNLCFDAEQTNCLADTDSGSSFLYGAGAKYAITPNLKLLAEMSRYNMELEADEVAGNVVSVNMGVSVIYSFE